MKILFLDRDGTLIIEPPDYQIDSIDKFALVPGVIPALLKFKAAGFRFVMISNQDGLGTAGYPQDRYDLIQKLLIDILESQGITFESSRICPHFENDNCDCRKPRLGAILDYVNERKFDREHSYVIGDRETDLQLAKNMGITGVLLSAEIGWDQITESILSKPRISRITRKTKETEITVEINLDSSEDARIKTGLGFFDHMLEQLSKHGGFYMAVNVQGDLHIDDHHTIEDTALAIGDALGSALGDKRGIARYGFLLPMDEARVMTALDLSGRPYLVFEGEFSRERVGDFSTELVKHFFLSLTQAMKATLHIQIQGENAHHMIEAVFKGVGRTIRQALQSIDQGIPSTKGIL